MATTILRVKRHLDESPAEALVIHCKRFKKDTDGVSEPSVFIFSGTMNEEENNENYLNNAWYKNDRSALLSRNTKLDQLKANVLKKKYSSDRRIEIINYSRGLIPGENNASNVNQADTDYALLDLCNTDKNGVDSKNYAYDLYFSQGNSVIINDINEVDGIHPINSEFHFNDKYREKGKGTLSDDSDDDEEDSNDENHCGNEYPDTDDSIGDEDMIRAAQKVTIDDDLSSDDGEENIVYGSGVNAEDVDKYGMAYAKYKARVLTANDTSEKLPELVHYNDSQIKDNSVVDEWNNDDFYYPINDDAGDDDASSKSSDNNDIESDID